MRSGLRRIERALALEPHNQRVLSRAANVARMRGRTDEAIRYSEQALEADSLSPNAHAVLGLTYYFAGRLDDAEAMRRKLLALSPLLRNLHADPRWAAFVARLRFD